jgi:hypothetical protein
VHRADGIYSDGASEMLCRCARRETYFMYMFVISFYVTGATIMSDMFLMVAQKKDIYGQKILGNLVHRKFHFELNILK